MVAAGSWPFEVGSAGADASFFAAASDFLVV